MNGKVKFNAPESIRQIVCGGGTWDAEGENLSLMSHCMIVKADGTRLSLPDGGVMSYDGTIIAHGDVTITEVSGKKIVIFTPRGKEVVIHPDGTVDKPVGAAVIVEIAGRRPATYFLKPPIMF